MPEKTVAPELRSVPNLELRQVILFQDWATNSQARWQITDGAIAVLILTEWVKTSIYED